MRPRVNLFFKDRLKVQNREGFFFQLTKLIEVLFKFPVLQIIEEISDIIIINMNSSHRIVSRLAASASVRDLIRRETARLLPSFSSYSTALGRVGRASSGKNV